MTVSRKFRLYAVLINAKTSREALIPEYEIGVIKAAWRGESVDVTQTTDVADVQMDAGVAYRSLLNRYNQKAVAAFFPGPERLEQDMQAAADKTDAWLRETEASQAAKLKKTKDAAKEEAAKETHKTGGKAA